MDNNVQNSTDFIPTPTQKKLCEALVNPGNRHKTVSEVCRIAKVDRKTYYNLSKKPEFVHWYQGICTDTIKAATGPLVNALIKEAVRGSFPHLKIALEMAEMLTDKQEHVFVEETYEQWHRRVGLDK